MTDFFIAMDGTLHFFHRDGWDASISRIQLNEEDQYRLYKLLDAKFQHVLKDYPEKVHP